MPTSDDRQLKQAYLHKLYDEWANTDRRSSHSLIEFFLDNGVDVEVPPAPIVLPGTAGTATVRGVEGVRVMRIERWGGRGYDWTLAYARPEIPGDTYTDRLNVTERDVADFVPDVILTKETVLTLLNRLSSPAYDYVNDRARAYSIVRNWAREQGIEV